MIDRRFVLLFVMTVCYQGHGEKLSQTESSSGFSAHVTRWVLPSWQRMMGWLKIALPLLVVGVVTKEQRCFTPFYSVLFVFSYFCYVELPFFFFLFSLLLDSRDPKDKLLFYAFIMNNKILLYLYLSVLYHLYFVLICIYVRYRVRVDFIIIL